MDSHRHFKLRNMHIGKVRTKAHSYRIIHHSPHHNPKAFLFINRKFVTSASLSDKPAVLRRHIMLFILWLHLRCNNLVKVWLKPFRSHCICSISRYYMGTHQPKVCILFMFPLHWKMHPFWTHTMIWGHMSADFNISLTMLQQAGWQSDNLNMNILVTPSITLKLRHTLSEDSCDTHQARYPGIKHQRFICFNCGAIAMTQGRVCLSTLKLHMQWQLFAKHYNKHTAMKSSVLGQLLQIWVRSGVPVWCTVSHAANPVLGPIWVYHVVSLVVGAMQPQTPASCQPHLSQIRQRQLPIPRSPIFWS